MSVFRFKRFSVVNEESAMKVNTDGVLLGASASIPEGSSPYRVLDIGTGTGTIALMVAQRLSDRGVNATIDAIDIDEPSAKEAAMNFASSPWAEQIRAQHASLADFDKAVDHVYDLIVSNPPYYDDSLLNPDERLASARHTTTLTFAQIAEFASRWLSDSGLLSLVLPADTERMVGREMRSRGLHMARIVRVRTSPRKEPKRIIVEFTKAACGDPADQTLIMQSPEYKALVEDFYL